MIDLLDFGTDSISFVFSLALMFYVDRLLGTFRGGMMSKAFRVFQLSTILLVASLGFETLDNFFPGINPSGVVSAVLITVFTGTFVYGFYTLNMSWTVRPSPKPIVAKGIASASESSG